MTNTSQHVPEGTTLTDNKTLPFYLFFVSLRLSLFLSTYFVVILSEFNLIFLLESFHNIYRKVFQTTNYLSSFD